MRKLSWIFLGIFISLNVSLSAYKLEAAEQYPVKPIVFIVPLEAGSDGDILARPLVQKASSVLGQPIMVVNKPGGGSSIGFREIHGARPDGYTIGMGTMSILTNKLQGIMPFDHHDFTLAGIFYRMYANVFGSTKTNRPFKTIQEVISFAKSHPGEIRLAAASVGSSLWVGAMAFVSGTGINVNVIPQPGAGAIILSQAAGGHVDLAVAHRAAAKPQLEAGNIRFLAVIGKERDPEYPAVPTLKDIGYDASWESSGIVMGPKKMPKGVVDKLTKAFEIAANDPEYQRFLLAQFATPLYISPDEVAPYLDGRRKVVRDIMDKAGILKEK